MRTITQILIVLVCAASAWAFNGPEDQAGALKVHLNGPEIIESVESPLACEAVLTNSGDTSLSGILTITVIDDWMVDGPASLPFSVEPGAEQRIPVTVVPGKDTLNAWYPVHARVTYTLNGASFEAQPILMVRTNVPPVLHPEPSQPWAPLKVPANGRRSLALLPVHRGLLEVFNEPPEVLPVGWRGTEPRTRTALSVHGVLSLPEPHKTLFVHPPWYEGRAGSLTLEFPLALPDIRPLEFTCAIAMNKVADGEPPSDGAFFRVYALPFDAPEGEKGTLRVEMHTDSQTWVPLAADLSAYAGQAIRLQLETHPGPKNDTTCDRALWGDPMVVAGTPPLKGPGPDAEPVALGAVADETDTYEVQVTPGARGLLDSRVAFINGDRVLSFEGFGITVLEDALGEADSAAELRLVQDATVPGLYRIRHQFRGRTGPFDLIGELSVADGRTLRASFYLENAPEPEPWLVTAIVDASLGSWNSKARRVYAGVGNVLEEPAPFTLHFDGHQLSTSFVGLDFENGMSLVQAVQAPPSKFEAIPESGVYTLHTPILPVFTLIPARDVWQGARAWHDVNGLKAAPGVERLSGRFVFDVWGGKYGAAGEALKQAFRYGLTNSVLVWHNWQRWGYDYRLPDIFPPNPDFGTAEEFAQLAETCKKQDVIFAPHDNYIDYYPDAPGYSYDHIGFNRDRQPIWAWLNEGRQAQAFRWRAEAYRPFLEANVTALCNLAKPNGYFIDVWSSIGPYDSWTRNGEFESRLKHRDAWAAAFNWIRDTLGNNAPQISESGHDQLIGSLDGAQTNHLRVDTPPDKMSWTVWNIRCADSERIPWADAAHHDRFVLHGAGYENRYCGGLPADLHGIYSDDYMTTEVLTGHPAMSREIFNRDVVRKYWLLNDLMTRLALKRIEGVAFDGDNPHRQRVNWEGDGRVWANRGGGDWQAGERLLPQYGFHAEMNDVSCAIERKGDRLVEWSKSSDGWYVNARRVTSDALPLSVTLASLNLTEGRHYEVQLRWTVMGPVPEDLSVYVHFLNADKKILFQADHHPEPPTSQWKDEMITIGRGTVPDACNPGDTFTLVAGLWKPGDRRRAIRGSMRGDASVDLGRVHLEGTDGQVTGMTVVPAIPEADPWLARMNPEGIPADFGGVVANGGCRLFEAQGALVVVPLPEESAFDITLDLATLPFGPDVPARVTCEALDGTEKEHPYRLEGGKVVLRCESGAFAYRVF